MNPESKHKVWCQIFLHKVQWILSILAKATWRPKGQTFFECKSGKIIIIKNLSHCLYQLTFQNVFNYRNQREFINFVVPIFVIISSFFKGSEILGFPTFTVLLFGVFITIFCRFRQFLNIFVSNLSELSGNTVKCRP